MSSPGDTALARIRAGGLLPILRLPSSEDVLAMSQALVDAGLRVIELSLTMAFALPALSELAKRFGPDVSIGAGTVLTRQAIDAAKEAGATFIVSPVTDVPVIQHAKDLGLAMFPGALSPTEVLAAWNAKADMVKVFPCHSVGGADYVRALKAPLPHVELLPTGGIHRGNAREHLEAGAAALGLGGDLVDLAALRAHGPTVIHERVREYAASVHAARMV